MSNKIYLSRLLFIVFFKLYFICKLGIWLVLVFQLTQHIRDKYLLQSFVAYFNCGRYVQPSQKEWGYFQCTKFTDNEIIIEFFNQYPIRGVKRKDFLD